MCFTAPESGGLPLKSEKRPPWALLGKVSQNMETILFKEKFIDWPDSSATVIGLKEPEKEKAVSYLNTWTPFLVKFKHIFLNRLYIVDTKTGI
jgi:supervillin